VESVDVKLGEPVHNHCSTTSRINTTTNVYLTQNSQTNHKLHKPNLTLLKQSPRSSLPTRPQPPRSPSPKSPLPYLPRQMTHASITSQGILRARTTHHRPAPHSQKSPPESYRPPIHPPTPPATVPNPSSSGLSNAKTGEPPRMGVGSPIPFRCTCTSVIEWSAETIANANLNPPTPEFGTVQCESSDLSQEQV
jgi:hypothetical protein